MIVSRFVSRIPKSPFPQYFKIFSLSVSHQEHNFSTISNQFQTLIEFPNNAKFVTNQVSPFQYSILNASILQRRGFSSSTTPDTPEKETSTSGNGHVNTVESEVASADAESTKANEATKTREAAKESDSGSEDDLTIEDLIKLVYEKDELLQSKQKEIAIMKDKALRTYAEMENIMNRTKREADSSKKFAIQSFAKSLLDVADNLERASSVVKESFLKLDVSKESAGAVPLLKTLLEGVEMTKKQLAEGFRKFGVEKFDPVNAQFDPNRHNAAFQVPDASKPPNTVAVVLKPGYMLHERVIRPAEVGVTIAVENNDAAKD